MLKFINVKTGENLDHIDFVEMVWKMAEERYNHTGFLWCNLNSYEQNQCYCIQFEDMVRDGWTMFPDEWRFQ
jgi:hypothetical protein